MCARHRQALSFARAHCLEGFLTDGMLSLSLKGLVQMSVCLRKGTRVPLSRNPKQKVQESQVRLEDCAVLPTEQIVWVHRSAEGLGQVEH